MTEAVNVEQNKNGLSVNLAKETFADMILNFLGKKEIVEYTTKPDGHFIVKLEDLEDFYYLLEQKIEREETLLVDAFRIELVYDNDTKRVINGFENLKSYFENRNVTPIACKLEWNIIMKFKHTLEVETQKIELFLNTDGIGSINVKVEYSNNIWGFEVLELFKNKINNLYIQEDKSTKLYGKVLDVCLSSFMERIITFTVVVLIVLVVVKTTSNKQIDEPEVKVVKEILAMKDNKENRRVLESYVSIFMLENHYTNDSIVDNFQSENIKNIMNSYIKDRSNKTSFIGHIIWITLFSILLLYLTVMLYSLYFVRFKREKSFILLTQKTENSYNKYKEKKSSTAFISISLIAFTLIMGLIVNFAYKLIA